MKNMIFSHGAFSETYDVQMAIEELKKEYIKSR